MARTFSDHARDKLVQLYRNHDHEVGSELLAQHPQRYASRRPTDCVTYALNVISHAFAATGNGTASRRVWSLGRHGNELSRYLVNSHRWIGVYINPDVTHPSDADPEHSYSNYLVNRGCRYYGIPISYRTVNYRPTTPAEAAFQKVNPGKPETALNAVDLNVLSRIPFGFGISRGARHTWLLSMGKVYEVHWDQVAAKLYEKTPLQLFGWLSGAVVVPPDQSSMMTMSSQSCARRRAQ